MKTLTAFATLLILSASVLLAQQPPLEPVDTAMVSLIKAEGLNNSKVMNLISLMTDVYGPRLTWSPEYRRGAEWAKGIMKEYGLQNIRYDNWAPVGKGWTLKAFTASLQTPVMQPLIGYPKAWSPGFREKEADVVFLTIKSSADFAAYKGKLKGKFVLINDLVPVNAHFQPEATRTADSLLLRLANADAQAPGRGRRGGYPRNVTPDNIDSVFTVLRRMLPSLDSASLMSRLIDQVYSPRKLKFAQDEGALCALSAGQGDGGTIFVAGATVPQDADVPSTQRVAPYDPKSPDIIPQVVLAAEHYNRLIRIIQNGITPRLLMGLEVAWTKADSSFNILGEIPGTDRKEEVVIVGGHFDTWHAGTGATDDATGCAAGLEAVRILQTVFEKTGVKPRRTIRLAFWGGEEQGLYGSREYVSEVYARRDGDGMFGGSGELKKTPEYGNFSVYFNHDNGTGRLRGVYLQGNEAARSIFRSWLTAYNDPTAQTLSAVSTGGTDHLSFDNVGLPGFQFIQDQIEYGTRTHHSNMDVYERVQPEDMKQAATLMAVFIYNAAQRDGAFPRKPEPGGRGGRP